MQSRPSPYPYWFVLPAAVIFVTLFLVPTVASLWFSLTRWDLSTAHFIGWDNYRQFFKEPFLVHSLVNTLIYAILTSATKTVFGLLLAVLLTSGILWQGMLRSVVFFPVLVSTIGVGITFQALLHPTKGIINLGLEQIGIDGPAWLSDPALALYSVAFIDVWKGVGLATLIFIAGLAAISPDYYEAARIDGATRRQQFWRITVPLVRPATVTVVTLSLIGGLRSFDIIWATTRGGPGFASDVLASVIYKQYQAGFYGLSTAGNVILFALIALIILPLNLVGQPPRGGPVTPRQRNTGLIAAVCAALIFVTPFLFTFLQAVKTKKEASLLTYTWPTEWHFWSNLTEVIQARNYMLLLAYFNSTIITVGAVTLLILFGAMVGYVLQRRPSGWNKLIYAGVLIGLMVPPAVVPTIWVLQGLGLFKTLHGMILIQVAYGLSFSILLYRSFIGTIPRDLDEAALIDGAKPLQIFFKVILPLLKPVTVTLIVVQSIAIFNDFTNPLYYLPGKENVTVQLTLFNFQTQFQSQFNLLFMNILLVTLPPLLVFIFFNRQIVAGMTAGGVKG